MLGKESTEDLKCLKRELKAWESMFERKHARKPTKHDVNSAPEEIRETYVKYNKLKRYIKGSEDIAIKDNNEEVTEEDDEVFGKSLNKSKTPVTSSTLVGIKTSAVHYKPVKLRHGQRPAKPSARHRNDNDTQFGDGEKKMKCPISSNLGFSISTPKKDEQSNRPGMMFSKSSLSKRMKQRSALASKCLESSKSLMAVTDEADIVNRKTNNDNSSECLPFLSHSTLGGNCEKFVAENEKLKFTSDGQVSGFGDLEERNCEANELQVEYLSTVENSAKDDAEKSSWKHESKITPEANAFPKENVETPGDCDGKEKNQSTQFICSFPQSLLDNKTVLNNASASKRKRIEGRPREDIALNGGRTKKLKISENVGKDVDMNDGDGNEEVDGDKFDGGEVNDGEVSGGELSDGVISLCDASASRGNVSKRSHRSSGLVSENFRALNLKVRRFSRRGQGTNYAAYKRKMWKQKQQANVKAEGKNEFWKKKKNMTSNGNGDRRISRSITNTTCFKCKADGHWAKDCPKSKGFTTPMPAQNWCEPVMAPADLEIDEKQWQNAEDKLKHLVVDRLPRLRDPRVDAPPAIEPLYQPHNDKPIDTPSEVYDALNTLGFDSFRCGQEEATMQILSGLSTLVVLSTGAGKSLCYQLPAYMYNKRSPCVTLVISPLVSLMEDQYHSPRNSINLRINFTDLYYNYLDEVRSLGTVVKNMAAMADFWRTNFVQVISLPSGLHGVSLNTNMTKKQREKAVDQICSGKVAVVLVSPEALVGGSSGAGCLPHPAKLPPIAFACIDEAHCVSEWSHNFRPSYLRVCKVLRERFGVRCFLGLTATATRSTALSVCGHLGIIHRPEAIVRGATIPENLHLSVSCDLNRDRAILELLQGSRFKDCDSIIIYCTRREQTDRLATYLRTCLQKNPMNTSSCITEDNETEDIDKGKKNGRRGRKSVTSKSNKSSVTWQAECYHAGLSAAQRKKVQKKFMAGEIRIVVATVAFGMGLDKADVRAVIHYNMPKSFESYVQEIGRAGRDGLPSHCHVFIDPEGKDVRELRRHAYANTVDRNVIKKLLSQVFPRCDCKTRDVRMKEEREKGISKSATVASSNDDSNWLDCMEDDVIDHVNGFESQSEVTHSEIRKETLVVKNENLVENDDLCKNDTRMATVEVIVKDDVFTGGEGDPGEGDPPILQTDTTFQHESIQADKAAVTDNVSGNIEPAVHGDISAVTSSDDFVPRDVVASRACSGHEVAIPIEKAVQQLDMKEESIETLLCYLELHEKRWIEILKSIRATCSLKFYGGPAHLYYVAERVPIVTAAVARARKRGVFKRNTSCVTFHVVEIVDEMGWDLEPVRRELYGLQYNEGLRLPGETGLSAGHSGIIVEFQDLAFRVRALGDLSGEERDEVCDFLEDRIMAQERSQLAQLHRVWSTFNTRAHPNCWQSAEECDKNVDGDLKSVIKAYFESKNDGTKSELEALATARKNSEFVRSVVTTEETVNWDAVSRDVRSFISTHDDLQLSGRAIARVFHGIDSPCFPAAVWGRKRGYWRRHLDVDFNKLRMCATQELVKFR